MENEKLFIVRLEDQNKLYNDICVKVYANDIGAAVSKSNQVEINEIVKNEFPDSDYDFKIASYYDINLMIEIK